MEYGLEELLPLVERLANKYTGFESTSVPYEKAEQFMGAVLYCIRETERAECNALQSHAITAQREMSAQQAYEAGLACVEKKVKAALHLYHKILPDFSCYENQCLYKTFAEGLPEFFKWYDIRFCPQNTILTLDYPLLEDISGYTGIDKIYEFLLCLRLEQKFLHVFPEEYVINIFTTYNVGYRDLTENLCEIMLMNILARILSGKPMGEADFQETDYEHIQDAFLRMKFQDIKGWLKDAVRLSAEKLWGGDGALAAYLGNAVDNVAIRLKNAAANGSLSEIL